MRLFGGDSGQNRRHRHRHGAYRGRQRRDHTPEPGPRRLCGIPSGAGGYKADAASPARGGGNIAERGITYRNRRRDDSRVNRIRMGRCWRFWGGVPCAGGRTAPAFDGRDEDFHRPGGEVPCGAPEAYPARSCWVCRCRYRPGTAPGCGRFQCPEQVQAALELAGGAGLGYLSLPGTRPNRERGIQSFGAQSEPEPPERELVLDGETHIPEQRISLIRSTECAGEIHSSLNFFSLNVRISGGTIACTSRQGGDGIRLSGRGCTKS